MANILNSYITAIFVEFQVHKSDNFHSSPTLVLLSLNAQSVFYADTPPMFNLLRIYCTRHLFIFKLYLIHLINFR